MSLIPTIHFAVYSNVYNTTEVLKSYFSVFSTTNETRSPRLTGYGRIGTCEMAQIDGGYSTFQPMMERGFPSNNRAKCILMNIRIINLSRCVRLMSAGAKYAPLQIE